MSGPYNLTQFTYDGFSTKDKQPAPERKLTVWTPTGEGAWGMEAEEGAEDKGKGNECGSGASRCKYLSEVALMPRLDVLSRLLTLTCVCNQVRSS